MQTHHQQSSDACGDDCDNGDIQQTTMKEIEDRIFENFRKSLEEILKKDPLFVGALLSQVKLRLMSEFVRRDNRDHYQSTGESGDEVEEKEGCGGKGHGWREQAMVGTKLKLKVFLEFDRMLAYRLAEELCLRYKNFFELSFPKLASAQYKRLLQEDILDILYKNTTTLLEDDFCVTDDTTKGEADSNSYFQEMLKRVSQLFSEKTSESPPNNNDSDNGEKDDNKNHNQTWLSEDS